LLVIILVPYLKVERVIFCGLSVNFLGSCPQYTAQSPLVFFLQHSVFLGFFWEILIIGLIFSYLVSCVIMTLSKKDFLIVIVTGLLQVASLFIIHGINVNSSTDTARTENIAFIAVMLILAILGFILDGKRKRTFLFTLIFPTILLLSFIFYSY